MVFGDITREQLLVTIVLPQRTLIGFGMIMRVMLVLEHHAYRLQVAMPRRGTPGNGERDGEKCAKARHSVTGIRSNGDGKSSGEVDDSRLQRECCDPAAVYRCRL